ncbi:hypothetical protein WDW89_25695 [Deltaproteobacteria bacterium TL4]
MGLSIEEKKEVEEIIESVVRVHNVDLSLLQQQWKKFKDAPEARLAGLEVQVGALGRELSDFKREVDKRFEQVDKRFEQIDKRFEQIDKRFEDLNKTLLRLHESMNAQVWKFLGGLGVILILLRLAGAIFPTLP